MVKFIGTLVKDEDGQICLKMQLSPQNPEEYEIPLEELWEEYFDKRVKIEMFPIVPFDEVIKKE